MEYRDVKIVDKNGEPLSCEDLYIFLRGLADNEWEDCIIDESDNLNCIIIDDMRIKYRELGG